MAGDGADGGRGGGGPVGGPVGGPGGAPAPAAVADGPFRAVLTTTGRATGADHSVELLAVGHGGRIYFSRHRPDSDWFRNAVINPPVRVAIGQSSYRGTARAVDDGRLAAKISALKYPGQARAADKRAVLEVTLGGLS